MLLLLYGIHAGSEVFQLCHDTEEGFAASLFSGVPMKLPCEIRLPCNQSKRVSKKCAKLQVISTYCPVVRTVYPPIESSLTGFTLWAFGSRALFQLFGCH